MLLEQNKQLVDATDDPAKTAKDGVAIYSNKPTLRSKAGVTWSIDEYAHPGLQRMYLKMKSFQRYTETYSLLQRATHKGMFSKEIAEQGEQTGKLRIASLGGGPGYELLAMRHFLEAKLPGREVELTRYVS